MTIRPIDITFFSKRIFLLYYFLIITLSTSSIYLVVNSPIDYEQADYYRLIYIHVPSAWLCMFLYFLLAFTSLCYLIFQNPLLKISSTYFAKLGLLFTTITLITGSLWGHASWGAYWVWDARLTSVLILFFLYIGYLIIYYVPKNKDLSARLSSLIAILGLINIPIIKYSVFWWKTLHQGASITSLGTSLHISILIPLLFITIFLVLYSVYVFVFLIRLDILKKKLARNN